MKKMFYLTLICLFSFNFGKAENILYSPNKKIQVEVQDDQKLRFSVNLNDQLLISNAEVDLIFNEKSLINGSKPVNVKTGSVNQEVVPVVSFKDSKIDEQYNLLRLEYSNNVNVEFRAYNDGFAYRFVTDIDQEVEVNEKAGIVFGDDFKLWASPIKGFQSSYEVSYEEMNISQFPDSLNTYLPLLIGDKEGNKILLTESDVIDYPHMFLKQSENKNQLDAIFPPYPLETEYIGDRNSKITKSADYIAKTNGNRNFPWRVMIITEDDADLVESNLVYLLAGESKLENTSWIKPGRVSWDWWNAMNLHGVDFKSGINTESYRYYIDFASQFGLEYIILDEGWSVSTVDLSKPNPDLDLEGLIQYGNEKNVKIILWATWAALMNQWSVLDNFQKWGIAGIKVDFMDRADQWMVNFYEETARKAAEKNLIVDFHGAYKPAGLRRVYPNVVTYEGVCGLEQCKWSKKITPKHDATLPFIRMVCGPMDYTPGAMRNFHSEKFTPVFDRPGSQGTRSHQVALFVIYESGIQMFADSPSNYLKEREIAEFLSKIPVVWDETEVFDAKVGEYIIVARRNGKDWFIGGICGENSKKVELDLSFLNDANYVATIIQDGINADRFAEDYKIITQEVNSQDQLSIKMVKGGGFAVILKQ